MKKRNLIDRSDFTEALSVYRQEQQTLTGIPLTRIKEDVVNIIRGKYPSTEVKQFFLSFLLFLFLSFRLSLMTFHLK